MQNHLEPALEECALGEFERLVQLEDGSGIIKAELLEYVNQLGEVALVSPRLRIASQALLGEVLAGLGEDEAVRGVLERNLRDCGAWPIQTCPSYECGRAAQITVIRILRTIARMEALELWDAIKRLYDTASAVPPVRTALSLTADMLAAANLDAHPGDMVRVVSGYSDRINWLDDDELTAYFAELQQIAHQREQDLRFREPGPKRLG